MNLEEFYAQIGGDYADTLQRLCNENMVKKFVKKYQVSAVLTEAMRGEKPLEDRSLLDAVEQQDAAIRRAISELE